MAYQDYNKFNTKSLERRSRNHKNILEETLEQENNLPEDDLNNLFKQSLEREYGSAAEDLKRPTPQPTKIYQPKTKSTRTYSNDNYDFPENDQEFYPDNDLDIAEQDFMADAQQINFMNEKNDFLNSLSNYDENSPEHQLASKLAKMEKEINSARKRISNQQQYQAYNAAKKIQQDQQINEKRRVRRKRRYKIFPIMLVSTVVGLLSLVITSLILAAYYYFAVADGYSNIYLPTIIYLMGIVVASTIASCVVRHRTMTPALGIAIIFWLTSIVVSFFADSVGEFKLTYILAKLLFSLVATVLAFVISGLIRGFTQKNKQRKAAANFISDFLK